MGSWEKDLIGWFCIRMYSKYTCVPRSNVEKGIRIIRLVLACKFGSFYDWLKSSSVSRTLQQQIEVEVIILQGCELRWFLFSLNYGYKNWSKMAFQKIDVRRIGIYKNYKSSNVLRAICSKILKYWKQNYNSVIF